MKFKVGDKVRLTIELTKADLAEVEIKFSADQVIKELGCNIFEVKNISEKDDRIRISLPSDDWWLKSEWFELAEPQVGDVWANADKSIVVKIVGEYIEDEVESVSYVILNGRLKGQTFHCFKSRMCQHNLLHRPQKPKKQSKPIVETPKKQEEEKWEPVIEQGIDSTRCFRKGNSIKWVQNDCEGIATCNKKDKFDLLFGIDLAWYRAEIKCHEAKIAEMLKEGAK